MQPSLRFLAAVSTLAPYSLAMASQCSNIDTCYEGGAAATPCSVSSRGCPPCVTFANDGCYVLVNGSCPFGVDCSSVWSGASTPSAGDESSSTTTSSPTDSTPTTPPSTLAPAPSTNTATSPSTGGTSKSLTSPSTTVPVTTVDNSSSRSSSSSGSSSRSPAGSSSSGSDMSVVFAIIGAAIGVIAVAVIFLTLVRRSKAAHDEDEDEITTTSAAYKKSQGSTNTTAAAAAYASYNGGNQTGNGSDVGADTARGISMNAMNYYNQQPSANSSVPSPRVAGRAIPSQPVGVSQSCSTSRPFGNNSSYAASGHDAMGMGATSKQTQPTHMQLLPMDGVAPSLQGRRESFEF
ncbi:hypothetical protein CCR75_004768 [Bremia lactucae]|uniref:Carbohydrate-binding protein n=1 Tax=Bremia lactucae TaxID=4779 RepID=A0A976IFC3_BRELC|nr:hypothetical protein CCR75_004768 [Bremia lactucae]